MKSTKDLNAGVKPAKVTGTVIYKLLNLTKGLDGTLEGPFMKLVPSKDRVQIDGEYKDIAAIQAIKPSGDVEFVDIWFQKTDGWQFILNPEILENRELIEYLELCNFNQSNPNRDPGAEAIFYRADPAKEAKEKVDAERDLTRAKARVFDFTDAELKQYAAARGMTGDQDLNVLRQMALDAAIADPKGFLAINLNKEAYQAVIENAKSQGIIKFDEPTKSWQWNDTNADIYKVTKPSKAAQEFAEWLKGEEGKPVFEHIKEKTQ